MSDNESITQPTVSKPLDVDGVTAFAVGTVLWLIALVVLLIGRDSLLTDDTQWWIWVCVVGVLIGVGGLLYSTRRRAAYARAAAQSHTD